MLRPLDGVVGERMELPRYYADFQRDYAGARAFWKLERGQMYAEPGNESWEAFDRGDWEASMRLLENGREQLASYLREIAGRGTVGRRVRIVSFPLTPYIQWELHVLLLRDEYGQRTRILPALEVAHLEKYGLLPDITTMDGNILYQVIYDDNGVLDHAFRYTEQGVVERCRGLIADLYGHGEPIGDFFQREVASMPPPRPGRPAIPSDYLELAGRPRPPRS